MDSRCDRFDYKCQPPCVGVRSAQIASMHEDRLIARLHTRPQINNGRLIRYLEFDSFLFPASLGIQPDHDSSKCADETGESMQVISFYGTL